MRLVIATINGVALNVGVLDEVVVAGYVSRLKIAND